MYKPYPTCDVGESGFHIWSYHVGTILVPTLLLLRLGFLLKNGMRIWTIMVVVRIPFIEHVWIFNLEPWDLSAGDLSIIIKLKTWS